MTVFGRLFFLFLYINLCQTAFASVESLALEDPREQLQIMEGYSISLASLQTIATHYSLNATHAPALSKCVERAIEQCAHSFSGSVAGAAVSPLRDKMLAANVLMSEGRNLNLLDRLWENRGRENQPVAIENIMIDFQQFKKPVKAYFDIPFVGSGATQDAHNIEENMAAILQTQAVICEGNAGLKDLFVASHKRGVEMHEAVSDMHQMIKALVADLDSKKVCSMQTDKQKMQKWEEEHAVLERQKQDLIEKVADFEREEKELLQKNADAEKEKEQKEQLVAELKAVSASFALERKSLKAELRGMSETKAAQEDSLKDWSKRLKEAEEARANLAVELRGMSDTKAAQEDSLRELRKRLKETEEDLESALVEKNAGIEEKESALKDWSKQLKEAEEARANLEVELVQKNAAIEEKEKAFKDVSEQLNKIRSAIEEKEKAFKDLSEQLNKIRGDFSVRFAGMTEGHKKDLEVLREQAEKEHQRYQSTALEKERLQQKLEQVSSDKVLQERAWRASEEGYESALAVLKAESSSLNSEKEQNAELLAEYREQLTQMEADLSFKSQEMDNKVLEIRGLLMKMKTLEHALQEKTEEIGQKILRERELTQSESQMKSEISLQKFQLEQKGEECRALLSENTNLASKSDFLLQKAKRLEEDLESIQQYRDEQDREFEASLLSHTSTLRQRDIDCTTLSRKLAELQASQAREAENMEKMTVNNDMLQDVNDRLKAQMAKLESEKESLHAELVESVSKYEAARREALAHNREVVHMPDEDDLSEASLQGDGEWTISPVDPLSSEESDTAQ